MRSFFFLLVLAFAFVAGADETPSILACDLVTAQDLKRITGENYRPVQVTFSGGGLATSRNDCVWRNTSDPTIKIEVMIPKSRMKPAAAPDNVEWKELLQSLLVTRSGVTLEVALTWRSKEEETNNRKWAKEILEIAFQNYGDSARRDKIRRANTALRPPVPESMKNVIRACDVVTASDLQRITGSKFRSVPLFVPELETNECVWELPDGIDSLKISVEPRRTKRLSPSDFSGSVVVEKLGEAALWDESSGLQRSLRVLQGNYLLILSAVTIEAGNWRQWTEAIARIALEKL